MRLLVLVLAATSIACGHPEPPLPSLSGTSRIEVNNTRGERLGVIEEPARVALICSFVTERRSGWEAPWYGVPVPSVNAVMFEGSRLKLSFGAGGAFFSAQYSGTFASRPASAQEVAAFRALLASPAHSP